MIRHVRDRLGRLELGIALHHTLLPGDLVEVLVIEHRADPLRVLPLLPVLGYGNQLGQVAHLHRAIADQGHHRALRMGEFRGNGIGHGGAHAGQAAGQ
ncbi:hypothetical protein D3C79_736530 [compost metagenome]